VTMKIIQGEVDYAGPHDVSIARYPLYKENEAAQHYIVGDYISCMSDRYNLLLNFNHEDPVKREIINHPGFLKALSVALNRNAINESLYFGLARMGQAGVLPGSRIYSEEYATAWAQYDPDLANSLLDEIGLDERDEEGFRLRSDGQKLALHIEHSGPRVGVATHEFSELVVDMWRDVGIDASTEEENIQLMMERVNTNKVDVTVWDNDRCTDFLFSTEPYFQLGLHVRNQAPEWRRWYFSDGKQGEQPPEHILARIDLFERWRATVDEDERIELMKELLRMDAERPLTIGQVLECPCPVIFNKNLRNLPRPRVPIGWDTYGISMYHPEALFYVGGQRA